MYVSSKSTISGIYRNANYLHKKIIYNIIYTWICTWSYWYWASQMGHAKSFSGALFKFMHWKCNHLPQTEHCADVSRVEFLQLSMTQTSLSWLFLAGSTWSLPWHTVALFLHIYRSTVLALSLCKVQMHSEKAEKDIKK